MASTLTIGSSLRPGLPDCRPTPVCDPRPVCPACGGLECLCRPRFFAGQLLSEEDLNRLDHYIVAKNRLHNRHLFGTGVVCGLEVVCSVCDPAGGSDVVVKPGYALSPCGNDIVVCNQSTVNVCDLINRCRPKDDCIQPDPAAPRPGTGDEDWILAICYQEKPSRGVTAMRGSPCGCGWGGGGKSGGCGCGGGGHSSATHGEAGCGCGGKSTAASSRIRSAAKPGPAPPLCEPTLTCESYAFAVYRGPKADSGAADHGALIRRFTCCYQPLIEQLTRLPASDTQPSDMHDWLTDHISTVREFLISEGLYDCDLAARLGAVGVPAPGADRRAYLTVWNTSALALLAILATVFQKCLCAALLPPCPPAEMSDCVPIATVTVSRGTCRVKQICNIGSRRFLITWPAVQYWLSWLPMFSSWQSGQPNALQPTLRDRLETLCCTPISQRFDFNKTDLQAGAAVGRAAAARSANLASLPRPGDSPAGSLHPFAQLLAESFTGQPEANSATLLMAAMGARAADGSPLASDAALQFPGEAMLVHQVVGPTLAPLLPLLGGGAPRPDIEELIKTVEQLKSTVDQQQVEITRLQRKG